MKKQFILASAFATCLSWPALADNPQDNTTNETTPPPIQTPQTNEPNTISENTKTKNVPINCEYSIPANQKDINPSLIKTWAQNATKQSFEFNAESIDKQLDALKACYTEQGWQSFYGALEQSGNINSIKTKHLNVSSQVDGDVQLQRVKDNQWKATIPLSVIYQNDKQKLTQLLSVDVLVGRKISGDLGIMQMIASPRLPNTQSESPSQDSTPEGEQPTNAPQSSDDDSDASDNKDSNSKNP